MKKKIFADKMGRESQKRRKTSIKWINKVKSDLSSAYELRGIHRIQESFFKIIWRKFDKKYHFGNIADRAYQKRETGNFTYEKWVQGILGAKVAGSTSVKRSQFSW